MSESPSTSADGDAVTSTQAWVRRQQAIRAALEQQYRGELDRAAASAKVPCRPELLAWGHDELSEAAATVDLPGSESAHHDLRLVLAQVLEKLALSFES